eukprot:GHRQ01005051.1.p2 GENE.GHRQ01005051.1~~GHRQ01005051.1.p2  ORF type:complete len:131 (+),score=62.11 GHRQ01005051.1:347-739(+)
MQQHSMLMRASQAPVVSNRRGIACKAGCGLKPNLAVQRRRRCPVLAAYQQEPNSGSSSRSSSSSSDSGSSSSTTALLAPTIFGSLEALLARQFSSGQPGQRSDWQELEGCWVLRPPGDAASSSSSSNSSS